MGLSAAVQARDWPTKRKRRSTGVPNDKTVLANEQVIAGECERCGAKVEQRLLEQWFFAISQYAPRLLANLDGLDWSETTKTAQRNWIGRSEGAETAFVIGDGVGTPEVRARSRCSRRGRTRFSARHISCWRRSIRCSTVYDVEQRAGGRGLRQQTVEQDLVSRRDRHRRRPASSRDRTPSIPRPGADPGLGRRLRAHGVRHWRDHGRARP